MWRRFIDGLVKGFASMVEDVRRNVLETGWFSKPVTGRTNTITVDMPGEQSPGDPLGRWRGEERASAFTGLEPCREMAAREAKSPDRGIDL